MKKIGASVLAFSILLTGCQKTTTGKVVDGQYALATINEEFFYADDIFKDLLDTKTGISVAYKLILEKLVKSKYPATDEMKTNAELICSQIEDSFAAGYGSMEDYKETLIYSLQYAEFIDHYVQEHYDDIYADYKKVTSPRIISLIFVAAQDVENMTDEEKSKLDEVKKLLDLGKDFGETAKSYSADTDTASLGGYYGLVDNTNDFTYSYGKDVLTAAMALNEGETSQAIKGINGYYFVHCDSVQDRDIEALIKNMTPDTNPLISYDQYMEYLVYQSYDIHYGNDEIKEDIENFIDEALKAREDARKSGEA